MKQLFVTEENASITPPTLVSSLENSEKLYLSLNIFRLVFTNKSSSEFICLKTITRLLKSPLKLRFLTRSKLVTPIVDIRSTTLSVTEILSKFYGNLFLIAKL